MSLLFLLFAPVFVLVCIGAAAQARPAAQDTLTREQARHRRRALAHWAARRGWSYDFEAYDHYDETFQRFSIFREGVNHEAFNVMTGWVGRYQALVFDLRWDVAERRRVRRHPNDMIPRRMSVRPGGQWITVFEPHVRTVVLLRAPHLTAAFILGRETMRASLGGALAGGDILMEAEEFNRAYFVTGPDRRRVFDCFTPRVQQHILDSRIPALESDGQWMLAHSNHLGLLEPRVIEWHLRFLATLLDMTPRHLHRAEPPQ